MTRFQLLAVFADFILPKSCAEVAKHINQTRSQSRAYRADLATRLRRLWSYGLLHRDQRLGWFFPKSKRKTYFWSITQKGVERLKWARTQGKV